MSGVVAVETIRRITVDRLETTVSTIHVMHRQRPFAAWVLAALLAAPAAGATDIVDVRAVAGLPRAGLVDGRAVAWRNVGIVAESDLLDAEVRIASCLPPGSAPLTPADRSDSGCGAAIGAFADGNLGHEFALTFKVPRWSEGAPVVDLTLRSWRAMPHVGISAERRDGSAGELLVTQPLGAIDAFAGFSTSMGFANAASRGRSAFAGVTWYAARRTRLELVADRAEDAATATVDRTLTLRILHTAAGNARIAAWTTRALDDPTGAWRVGAGLEIAY